jgi:CheY-like chemotaxis protein
MEGRRLILFLDDVAERAALFSARSTGADRARTIWARTAAEAVEALEVHGPNFDALHLDHDLGGSQYQDSRSEDSGMEVVRWLERHDAAKGAKVTIHTWNLPAGKRMVERLSAAGYKVTQRPFGM